MKFSFDKGISLSEVIIAFSIIATLFTIFLSLSYNYLIVLNTVKERLLALSLANEGLELAIALRNIQYENPSPSNWLGVDTDNSYCLDFDTSIEKIITSTPSDLDGCTVFTTTNMIFKRIVQYQTINADSVKVISQVSFANQKVSLDTILVNWK